MSEKRNIIILAARNQLAFSNFNSQMTPIHGKPAISWVIDLYIKYTVTIVINKNNQKLKEYISYHYPTVKIVSVDTQQEYTKYNQFSIVNSIQAGLETIVDQSIPISIVLGDTYCSEQTFSDDAIYVSDNIVTSEKWCLVEKNKQGFVNSFYDKIPNITVQNKFALIGIYNFSDVDAFKDAVLKTLKSGKGKISDILKLYNIKHNILCISCSEWIDFGHKAGIIEARKKFYNARNFNSLISDSIQSVITKKSSKKQKLEDEYFWYKNVPAELQSFVPRVFATKDTSDFYELTMEKYGYPPLSELWLYGDFDIEEWQLIVDELLKIRLYMDGFKGDLPNQELYSLYVNKFIQRIDELKKSDDYWKKMLAFDDIVINGVVYKNLNFYYEKLICECEKLVDTSDISVMHGDFCFSNILFDTQNFICKIIDPRGRLQNRTIYGDARYDIAKLRHSLVGGYDFIVHDLYQFSDDLNNFSYKDGGSSDQELLKYYFDDKVSDLGYNLNEIKLIECCLFLSMIPLHNENFRQQKIFYIKGIQKLNEYFEEINKC